VRCGAARRPFCERAPAAPALTARPCPHAPCVATSLDVNVQAAGRGPPRRREQPASLRGRAAPIAPGGDGVGGARKLGPLAGVDRGSDWRDDQPASLELWPARCARQRDECGREEVRRPDTPRRSGGAARAPRPAARRERRAGRVWRRAVFNVLSRIEGTGKYPLRPTP